MRWSAGDERCFRRCSCPQSRRPRAAGQSAVIGGFGRSPGSGWAGGSVTHDRPHWRTSCAPREELDPRTSGCPPGSGGGPGGCAARGGRARRDVRRTTNRLEQQRGPQRASRSRRAGPGAAADRGRAGLPVPVAGTTRPPRSRRRPRRPRRCWAGVDRLSDTRPHPSPPGRDAGAEPMAERCRRPSGYPAGPCEIYRWFTDPAERLRYPEETGTQSRARSPTCARLRLEGRSRGPGAGPGATQGQPGVRGRWNGTRWPALSRTTDPAAPRARRDRGGLQVLFTRTQSQALLVLTAPPPARATRSSGCWAVLGQERFAPCVIPCRYPVRTLVPASLRCCGAVPASGASRVQDGGVEGGSEKRRPARRLPPP